MKKTFKIPFAFDDQKNVIDMNNAEKGVVYKCSCGVDVKLRGGMIISDHFYHIDKSHCSLETSIHKAYKNVFKNLKKIKLPYDINGMDVMEFDRVELEKKIDNYIPDAIGYIGDEKYLIEFAKSSYIGERKLKKIKKSNLFCIEVDIIKTKTTIEAIENHLLNERDYKHIVHIPEYREMTELKEKFKDEWYKLKNKHRTEIEKLRDEINDLQQKIVNISAKANEYNDVHLYYKKDCKNGAKMYVSKHSRGNVVAFEKNKIISCYFK